MKSKLVKFAVFSFLNFIIFVGVIEAQLVAILDNKFDLAGPYSQEIQYYRVELEVINYALDGTRIGTDIFHLLLKCVPSKITGKERDEYTCVQFTIQQGETSEVVIPALKNWTYSLTNGIDHKGRVLGINHNKFENLKDGNGNILPPGQNYLVYNLFIDFHSICNIFAEEMDGGNGIQNLQMIGQEIVHYAAFSEPPVNLGSTVSEGSFFKNGEITLEFKGVSIVNDRSCALLEYDSGESSYKMIMKPMPDMEIQIVGSSHYKGDIYKDLASYWVQKATMMEVVVSETTLPTPPNKINSVIERNIMIRNVSEAEFGSKEINH